MGCWIRTNIYPIDPLMHRQSFFWRDPIDPLMHRQSFFWRGYGAAALRLRPSPFSRANTSRQRPPTRVRCAERSSGDQVLRSERGLPCRLLNPLVGRVKPQQRRACHDVLSLPCERPARRLLRGPRVPGGSRGVPRVPGGPEGPRGSRGSWSSAVNSQ